MIQFKQYCCAFLACIGSLSLQQVQAQKNTSFEAYLFAYFEGKGEVKQREQIRFAVSKDAVHWKALNANKPVLESKAISQTGGVRDPHILRGEDQAFYMVATDMFTHQDGWESNPGITMLRSTDLIHWKHSIIDFAKAYPEKFGDVKWVWAPQTFYDPRAKKYLVYFTIRQHADEYLDLYGAYANADFTGFESEPKLMFRAKYGSIDGDIVYKDGLYHLFYKGNTKDESGKEINNGIQQATSRSLFGPWKEDFKYLDVYAGTKTNVEGSSVFKLNERDEYVLMYDLYSSGRYEFQTSTDLRSFSKKPQSFTKDFFPRHGSVISLTQAELDRLDQQWGHGLAQTLSKDSLYHFCSEGNPIIKHKYSADPAAMVLRDTLWLFTGRDRPREGRGYNLKEWNVFSTTDLKNWTEYPVPLKISDFAWDRSGNAYAGHAIEHKGKYYWYISTNGSGIGVAVADRPEGPYKDALGKPLLTRQDCFASSHGWACIDPAIFIDDDGTPWLFWGNGECYYVKLKDNMIELDGEIKQVQFDGFEFEEAPWVHKKNGHYYLSYATGFPEKIAYAMADHIEGPYVYQGILNEVAGNSNTNHQAIVDFKGKSYFIYHNGVMQREGSSNTRSVCIDELHYNPGGSMQRVVMTSEGVSAVDTTRRIANNPILKGYYADPEIIYSEKDQQYYLYPTSDGFDNWGGYYFKTFSSTDLKTWKDEGVILDLKKDVPWAGRNAWAPTIIEKKDPKTGAYRYYFYYTGAGKIGVATADEPTGPFIDSGKPLVAEKPAGINRGAEIDPDVFHDPVSGKDYILWGNGYVAIAELKEDMLSYKPETLRTFSLPYFREATEVFYRKGWYYFLYSENDTRSEDYRVRYAMAKSLDAELIIPEDNLILNKLPEEEIYGTGHNAVLQIPNTDEWYMIYHRFKRPEGILMGRAAGYHREVCMDRLEFNTDGTIRPVQPTP